MKRILILSVMMLVVANSASLADDADFCFVPVKFRIHWSPYEEGLLPGFYHYSPYDYGYGSNALITGRLEYSPYSLKYGSTGLTFDTLHYSPYALYHGSSGLIDACVRYSPYAFGFNKSGLIAEGGPGCFPVYTPRNVINVILDCPPQSLYAQNRQYESFSTYARRENKEAFLARKANLEIQQTELKKIQKDKAEDPSQAIREVLNSRNIPFTTNRSLRINGKTVSVNFYIEDANIIIKFWNSKEITEIGKAKDYRENIYQDYVKSWKEYFVNEVGNSKNVFYIIAGSKEEIYKQLDSDDNSKSVDNLYALAQSRPSLSSNR